MDFNIKKHINNIKKNILEESDEKKIEKIINVFLETNLEINCSLKNGIVYLNNVEPILRTKIKLRKNEIINKTKEHNIYVRDII